MTAADDPLRGYRPTLVAVPHPLWIAAAAIAATLTRHLTRRHP